jgi:ribosomal protein S18 acetylase RimI-like enzyme
MKIKIANRGDTEQLTKLYKKLYKGDEKTSFYYSKADPTKFSSGSKVFIAVDKNKIVGFCWSIFYEHVRNKGVGYIEELYVDEAYRRRGIGNALIKEAVASLKREKASVIFVFTGPHLEAAKKFYKGIGFRRLHSPVFVLASYDKLKA